MKVPQEGTYYDDDDICIAA